MVHPTTKKKNLEQLGQDHVGCTFAFKQIIQIRLKQWFLMWVTLPLSCQPLQGFILATVPSLPGGPHAMTDLFGQYKFPIVLTHLGTAPKGCSIPRAPRVVS